VVKLFAPSAPTTQTEITKAVIYPGYIRNTLLLKKLRIDGSRCQLDVMRKPLKIKKQSTPSSPNEIV